MVSSEIWVIEFQIMIQKTEGSQRFQRKDTEKRKQKENERKKWNEFANRRNSHLTAFHLSFQWF